MAAPEPKDPAPWGGDRVSGAGDVQSNEPPEDNAARAVRQASVTLTLPYPPSANALWRVFRGRSIKSRAYREWLADAAEDIERQAPQIIEGAYDLVIHATRPDRRARDIDNLLKPV